MEKRKLGRGRRTMKGTGWRHYFARGAGVALFLILLFPLPGAGEEKLVLGLPQLIRMAMEKSPEIAATRSDIAGARSQLAQAEAGYYPQLDTTAIIGPINNTRRPAVVGTRIIDPSADLSIGAFGRLDLTLTQPIFTFGKISNRREAAARGVMAKEAQLAQKRNETALRVRQLYYALVIARAGLEAARDAAGYFNEARDRMDRLLKLGSSNVTESDVDRIDAYRAETLRARAEAEKGERVAYFALKSFIQVPPGTDFEPAEKMLPVKEEKLDEIGEYIQRARAQRPEFRQLEEGLRAQKASVEGARSDLYPSFFAALAGSFAGAPGRQAFHNPYIFDDFNHVIGGVVGGVNWHFDFGITRGRLEKERADYEKLVHTKALADLGIPIEVATRYQETREWRVAIDAYDRAATASRKWIVAALTSFDMGAGTADELLRSIERYGQNRGKYLEALFNYNVSLAQLEYATGVQSW